MALDNWKDFSIDLVKMTIRIKKLSYTGIQLD